MRILVGYVTQLQSSGVDKYLLNVLSIAKNHGVTLDFLTSQYNADTEQQLSEYGCRLFTIRSLKNPVGHYKDVKAVLQNGDYDKAYFNISEPLNMMGAKAAHDCCVPCIVHAHSSGMDISNNLKRFVRGFINTLCRPILTKNADIYVACSRKAGEWMYTRKALNSDKYHTVYNAVDTSLFSYNADARNDVRQRLNISDSTIVVGHIGSYCYAKNNFFLVDIAKELTAIKPDSMVLCIGDGDDHAAVQEYASSMGMSDHMNFVGVQKDIPSMLSAMDVFVLPSRFEGAPIAAVEAQASGVPCIISDRVTDEVVVSSNTVQLSIDSAKPWAKAIITKSCCDRSGILPEMMERYSLECQQKQIVNLLF